MSWYEKRKGEKEDHKQLDVVSREDTTVASALTLPPSAVVDLVDDDDLVDIKADLSVIRRGVLVQGLGLLASRSRRSSSGSGGGGVARGREGRGARRGLGGTSGTSTARDGGASRGADTGRLLGGHGSSTAGGGSDAGTGLLGGRDRGVLVLPLVGLVLGGLGGQETSLVLGDKVLDILETVDAGDGLLGGLGASLELCVEGRLGIDELDHDLRETLCSALLKVLEFLHNDKDTDDKHNDNNKDTTTKTQTTTTKTGR